MFLPALASQSFRLAGQDIALTLVRVVFGNVGGFRQGREAKRNGAFAVRFRVSLRVACFSAITALAGNGSPLSTALAGNPCTIPFCRKREALDREGGRHRQGTRWIVRTGWQNGIPYPQGRALADDPYRSYPNVSAANR